MCVCEVQNEICTGKRKLPFRFEIKQLVKKKKKNAWLQVFGFSLRRSKILVVFESFGIRRKASDYARRNESVISGNILRQEAKCTQALRVGSRPNVRIISALSWFNVRQQKGLLTEGDFNNLRMRRRVEIKIIKEAPGSTTDSCSSLTVFVSLIFFDLNFFFFTSLNLKNEIWHKKKQGSVRFLYSMPFFRAKRLKPSSNSFTESNDSDI